ncbi:hypothetical protein GP486_001529 [Trichoglossum hirsutum]|uniref:Ankyrin n=1 Tax=Trichoglossum hirsutum TaxID=265104 RepID=A0A9P8LH06_9PEZI|nr:hypothetical protein GP486_001529 [Trichoglossum hirsutum]
MSSFKSDESDIADFLPEFSGFGYLQDLMDPNNRTNRLALPWKIQAEIVRALENTYALGGHNAAAAAYELAFCYQCGLGVIEDSTRALSYIATAAAEHSTFLFIWFSFYTALSRSQQLHKASTSTLIRSASELYNGIARERLFAGAFRQSTQRIRKAFVDCRCLLQIGEDIVLEEFTIRDSADALLNVIEEHGAATISAVAIPYEKEDENVEATSISHYLASAGLLGGIQMLIANGLDVDQQDEYGDTALLRALQSGDTDMAKYLVEIGANVAIANDSGVTAAHCLIYFEPAEARWLADLLHLRGTDFNAQSSNPTLFVQTNLLRLHGSPLHWAISVGDTEIVQILLRPELNVDFNAPYKTSYNGPSQTPLSLATALNLYAIVDLLLSRGATHIQDGRFSPPFHYLLRAPTWQRWLHHGHEYRQTLTKTVGAYTTHSDGRALTELDSAGFCPLLRAAFDAQSDSDVYALEELLQAGADPHRRTKDGSTILHWIIYGQRNNWGKLNLFKKFVELGVSLDHSAGPDENTLLHHAARFDTFAIAEYLIISRHLDVNVRNKLGWTPLHTSIYYDHGTKLPSLLLSHGAAIDATDLNGRTPLALALDTSTNHLAVLQLLLSRSCSLIVDVKEQLTVLHYAVASPQISAARRRDFVVFLLRNERVLNIIDEQIPDNGMTALHLAALRLDYPSARMLVDEYATIGVVDSDGNTAEDLARRAVDVAKRRGGQEMATVEDALRLIEVLVSNANG